MQEIKKVWKQSKLYRVLLIAAVIYTVLRLIFQGGYLAMMLLPELGIMGGVPDWVGTEGAMIPADLQIYLNAAKHFYHQENLYLQGSLERLEDHFPYGPPFAMIFTPFLLLSPGATAVVHTVLHFIAYGFLYLSWNRIFKKYGLERAHHALAWTLPMWLVFSSFWTDLGYLNIYIIMALFGTLFIEAIMDEHFGWSLFWLSVIIQIKPHWTFAAVVPLLLGRRRFFFKLISWAIVVYVAVVGLTLIIAGPTYGWQQYGDYVEFLGRLSRDFPWRGPEAGFLGYNHSIKQIVVYALGTSQSSFQLATVIKALLLLPLAGLGLHHLLHPVNRAGNKVPQLSLDFAFALYLGAFIWLDMVWELSLGVAIFPYLLGTLQHKKSKILASVGFLPYALLDPWRVGSFAIGGMSVILPGPYVATDPAIYIPLIIIAILTFYVALIIRLYNSSIHKEE